MFGAGKLDAKGELMVEVLFGLLGVLSRADGVVSDIEAHFTNELMDELDLMAYRFSVAWPRIQPTGAGPVDHVDYLDRVFFIRTLGEDVELPRSASDVIAVAPSSRDAVWHVVRADYPTDAFVFVRDRHGAVDGAFGRRL